MQYVENDQAPASNVLPARRPEKDNRMTTIAIATTPELPVLMLQGEFSDIFESTRLEHTFLAADDEEDEDIDDDDDNEEEEEYEDDDEDVDDEDEDEDDLDDEEDEVDEEAADDEDEEDEDEEA